MSVTRTSYPTTDETYARNTVPPVVLTATNSETVTAILEVEDGNQQRTVVFTGSYAPNFDGDIVIDFKGLYDPVLKTVMPTTNPTIQDEAWRHFRCHIVDSNGVTLYVMTWYVANARLKSSSSFEAWAGQNFLTNQPLEKHTTEESPEWLTWLDIGGSCKLKAVFYPISGGNETVLIRQTNAAGCYTADVSYATVIQLASLLPNYYHGYYDIILTDSKDSQLALQRYLIHPLTGFEHYFCFVNALGGIDTLICQGANSLQPETTYNIGRFSNSYVALDDTDDRRKWQQLTGHIPHKWRNWVCEVLAEKKAAAKYDPATGEYTAIVLTGSDIDIADYGQLGNASFNYILDDIVSVVSDNERADDRMLHQSAVDQVSAFDNQEQAESVTLRFTAAHGGGYETEAASIAATTLYVEWDELLLETPTSVIYSLDGVAESSFNPSNASQPVIVKKTAAATVKFTETSLVIDHVRVSYIPTTTQNA